MISVFKAICKIILSLAVIFSFIIALLLTKLALVLHPHKIKRASAFLSHIFGKTIAFILGIKITIPRSYEIPGMLKNKGALYVCNHLSYIDGIIATSLLPLLFISRRDLKTWPLFGTFALLSNTIFINRNFSLDIPKELKEVIAALEERTNVILFPEGTSSDGTKLLPFKSSFFAAALEANTYIVPLAIKYKKINSSEINEKSKDFVYWYGEMFLFPHLLRLCTFKKIEIEVRVCQPINPKDLTQLNPAQLRKYLSETVRKEIEEALYTD